MSLFIEEARPFKRDEKTAQKSVQPTSMEGTKKNLFLYDEFDEFVGLDNEADLESYVNTKSGWVSDWTSETDPYVDILRKAIQSK